jgi:predicted nucleic acid-binding Zn ribbon protein
MVCVVCDKPLPKGRRRFCSERCSNRAGQVSRYGLTPEQYRILVGDGHCPICGRKMRKINVDHDWKTKLVRGAVCGTCNKRVLTAITTARQAFALLEYLSLPPASKLDGGAPTVTNYAERQTSRRFF